MWPAADKVSVPDRSVGAPELMEATVVTRLRSSRLVRLGGLAVACALSVGAAVGSVAVAGPSDRHTRATAFQRLATFPVYRNSTDPQAETVAEITAASTDGRTLISTDSPGQRVTFTNVADPARPLPAGGLDVGGEPTSVSVYRSYALVAVNTSGSFTQPSGELVVISLANRSIVTRIDLGGQPDSIAITPHDARGGDYAAIAIENERDENVNDGEIPQLPGGYVVALDLTGAPTRWVAERIELTPSLIGVDGVHAPQDPEPEYVTVNDRNQAAVTLQENNAIAVIDLPTRRVLRAFTAGTVDLSGVDAVEDGAIDPTGSLTGLPREPDGIAWIGDGLVGTANEGDLAGGTRGWSVIDARTGQVVWDAGNTLEREAIRVGLYPESRSENKGTEPENITVSAINGRRYAFVGAERGNFVAVYDLTNPRAPRLTQILPVTNGPEGLLTIPARGLLVVSSETDVPEDNLRSTISLFRLTRGAPAFPSIESASPGGVPIGWGALSALAADPRRPDRLWTVGDSYYTPTMLYPIDVPRSLGPGRPALITGAVTVTENGRPVGVDAEGLAVRAGGGFWLAAEGATGSQNQLLRLDPSGAIQQRIAVPADITAGLTSRGLEGVTVTGTGRNEQVIVALQSPLSTDPAGITRIGRYTVATGTWSWYGYRLDAGSSVGLSEIVSLGGNRFAVLERDNLAGPTAAVKRIYQITLPATPATDPLPTVSKRLVRDLLPVLTAGRGWTQEKVEGLTVAGNGRVYLVTDNDGVEDATGETLFADLGSTRKLFGTR